jgi:hypothetical protein
MGLFDITSCTTCAEDVQCNCKSGRENGGDSDSDSLSNNICHFFKEVCYEK